MRGVYLVAAELSKHGFIASPTSRGARAADILATDAECKRAFSVQVKPNPPSFLLAAEPGRQAVRLRFAHLCFCQYQRGRRARRVLHNSEQGGGKKGVC